MCCCVCFVRTLSVRLDQVEVLEYPELGMEAVWKIEVKDFPAFIVTDDKGEGDDVQRALLPPTVLIHLVCAVCALQATTSSRAGLGRG
jgi:hypothetical protein